MDSSVSLKDKIWFLLVCHHISNAVYFCTDFYTYSQGEALGTAWLLSVSSWLLPGNLQVTYFPVTSWLLLGYFLVTVLLLSGYCLVTAPLLPGYFLVIAWLFPGYFLVTA